MTVDQFVDAGSHMIAESTASLSKTVAPLDDPRVRLNAQNPCYGAHFVESLNAGLPWDELRGDLVGRARTLVACFATTDPTLWRNVA